MMNLDKRQKVIVVLIVLALAVLVWQIYKIASSEHAAPAAASVSSSTAPTKSTRFPAVAQAVHTNAVETAAMLSNAASNTTTSATDTSGANQQNYLELVNEYQMSEIQRMIAEDQASIAQARYTAAEALSKITALSGSSANLSDLVGTTDQTNSAGYELIYTGEDSGQWTATLKKNGQFNDVTAGSVLPDGANVLSVDDNGVLLQIGNKKELITFNGVMPFDSNAVQIGSSITANTPNLQNQIAKKPTAAPAIVQKTAVASPNKLVASSTTPTPATAKINTGVSSSLVPVATSVADFVPDKQPNLSAADTAKENMNVPAITSLNVNPSAVDGYTIQLIADDNLSSVNNFITVNQLQNNAHALKTSRNGKSWYVVVYGSYPTAADAERALSTMPNGLHNQHPFVRKLSDVQSKAAN
jgi:septal ring-binding cell division protein DamX